MITKADKGNSIVISYIQDYNRRNDNFISNNRFTLATRDITNNLQRDVKTATEACREVSGFGSLEVACWPLVLKFAGSNPAEAVGFFRAKKSSARLPSEGK